jgi:hypothetical protein
MCFEGVYDRDCVDAAADYAAIDDSYVGICYDTKFHARDGTLIGNRARFLESYSSVAAKHVPSAADREVGNVQRAATNRMNSAAKGVKALDHSIDGDSPRSSETCAIPALRNQKRIGIADKAWFGCLHSSMSVQEKKFSDRNQAIEAAFLVSN